MTMKKKIRRAYRNVSIKTGKSLKEWKSKMSKKFYSA